MKPIVEIVEVSHHYGKQQALHHVSLNIGEGERFGFLGPNGGGKSTLFRILSTAMVPTAGSVNICGVDAVKNPTLVRNDIGVVFQTPGLDKKLSAKENLLAQGHLYGLRGPQLRSRVQTLAERLGLETILHDRVEKLSGGFKRRVEIAKGLLHDPKLLLLDEPTTGLDPLVRREVWEHLRQLKLNGKTILLTTHLLDEADQCDRIALIHGGRVVALGTPLELKSQLGGEVLTLQTRDPEWLVKAIREQFSENAQVFEGAVRIQRDGIDALIPRLRSEFGEPIESIHWGKPTLEDLFIQKTGQRLTSEMGHHP